MTKLLFKLCSLVVQIFLIHAVFLQSVQADSRAEAEFSKQIAAMDHASSVNIKSVLDFSDEFDWIKNYRLLKIIVSDPQEDPGTFDPKLEGKPKQTVLRRRGPPMPYFYGEFANQGDRLIYLNGNPQNVAKILKEERVFDNPNLDLRSFATFLARTLVQPNEDEGYHLISKAAEIKSAEWSADSDGYKINKKKFNSVKGMIAAPHWDKTDGKTVFIAYYLSGWLHEADTVNQVTYTFDREGNNIQIENKPLVDGIYRKFPEIYY